MARIIALQGKGQSGKTTTLNLLTAILIANGYRPVPGMYQNHGTDFVDVYLKGKIKVGISSAGDTFDLIKTRVAGLVAAHCDVCICSCRTFDRGKKPGTVAAVKSFPGYTPQFNPKTYAAAGHTQTAANNTDATTIFKAI